MNNPMKKCVLFSAALCAALVSFAADEAVTAAAPAETFDSVMKEAQNLRNGKQRDEAVAKAGRALELAAKPDDKAQAYWFIADNYWSDRKPDVRQEENLLKALAVEGISPAKRQFLVKDIVNKYYRNKGDEGFEKGKALIEETLAMPAISNAAIRIDLTSTLAMREFSRFQVEDAEKRLADLEKLPGLTKQNLCDIYFCRANLAKQKKDYAEAIRQYARIHSDPEANANQRMNAFNSAASLLSEERRYDEIIALATKYMGEPSFAIFAKEANMTKAIVPAYIAKKDYKAAIAATEALLKLDITDNRTKNETENVHRSLKIKVLDAANDLEGAKAHILANAEKVGGWSEVSGFLGKLFDRGDYASTIEVGNVYWAGIRHTNWQVMKSFDNILVSYWRLGKGAEAAEFIERTFSKMERAEEKDKVAYRIIQEFLQNGNKLSKGDLRNILKDVDGKVAKEALSTAGKILVRFGRIDEPKLVYDYRQSLFVPHARNMAAVRYVKNAPTDFGSWQASGLMTEKDKHVCDVKFGKEAAERLITDVAVIRGDAVNASASDESAAWFWVCYDEYGIHFLFEHKDPKFQEVLTGKTRSTDYEMYFGIGETGPTYQFGVNPTKREFDYCPAWNSPHKFFRLLADYADFSSRPSKEGYATAMNVSWELAYNCLPENGTEWPFEMIYWSRSGGLTWGGTDIWQRSNWGHWKFEGLNREVKSAIHRVIVYKALARYNAEKNIAGGGIIGTWKDAELGDPDFYEKELKSIVEKLDAYAQEAAGEMTDALADKLFKEAVPGWYDFKFVASEIRTHYLEKQLTE